MSSVFPLRVNHPQILILVFNNTYLLIKTEKKLSDNEIGTAFKLWWYQKYKSTENSKRNTLQNFYLIREFFAASKTRWKMGLSIRRTDWIELPCTAAVCIARSF